MKTHETVQETVLVAASVGQVKDVIATIVQAVPNLTHADAQSISGRKRAFIADINAVFRKYAAASVADATLLDWVQFYREMFGIELDLSKVVLPALQEGADRLLVIAEGLSAQRAYDVCKQHFSCWKYADGNLDEAVPTNDRDPKTGSYAIRIRECVEADEDLANKSADDLAAIQMPGITLLERLVYELKYWKETGKHLDRKNLTLCSGSRYRDGGVPGADWSAGGEFSVDWCDSTGRDPFLRSRRVWA